jgi:nitrogen-specific signal transduction histidine kinase
MVVDPIRDPADEVVGYAKITRDLTERCEAQTAIEKMKRILLQSQKMEAMGQLTSGIAHDFNNVLMAIMGSLEVVRRRTTDPAIIRLINNAMGGAERGTSLTHRMLAFARDQEVNSQPVDLVTVVGGMTELLKRSLGPSVTLESRIPQGMSLVTVDANQLEMVLLNLSVNGRDAMPAGGRIVISARRESVAIVHGPLQPGEYVCLSLADSGVGMDEETLARATNPFFTTKDVGKGTGLGLSMARSFAEHSGGQLVLTSRKGHGTTVELWLPVARENGEAIKVKALPATPEKRTRELVVLVVDDDPYVRTNIVAMLEDCGHKVLESSSADEALAILSRDEAIQLVITDHAMSHMTGLRLIEIIRDRWPHLRVILATGIAELPLGTERGPITLVKPFRERGLADAVEAVMSEGAQPNWTGGFSGALIASPRRSSTGNDEGGPSESRRRVHGQSRV